MGNKNKTISFRVNEELFEALRDIAEEREISLSALFRDYVETFVAHDGQVTVVPEDELEGESDEFPPTIEVPTSFVREHERLELEAEHLREQLEEHKRHIQVLQEHVDRADDDEDVVYLEELDENIDFDGHEPDEPYQLG